MADGSQDFTALQSSLRDGFGRTISYLRVSVTDRCDFRCVYCMSETPTFVPKAQVLSLDETARLCGVFVALGVRKLRLTGGEPLIRRGLLTLARTLGAYLDGGGLDELAITTNGSRLAEYAEELALCGVRRVNVSLDTLRSDRFRAVTRRGDIAQVFRGLEAARAAGLAVKINTVAMKGINDDEFDDLIGWCGEQGFDMTLIEVMPLGDLDDWDRLRHFLPMTEVRAQLSKRWGLEPLPDCTGGPARYVQVRETGRRLGFITPLSGNFCGDCNRVRLSCSGRLYLCLGQERSIDLCSLLRAHPQGDDAMLRMAVRAAISRKPEGHDFAVKKCGVESSFSSIERRMHVTGG
ncbi:GTP 3',8-cyclase [Azospirillaceae bacterium]